MYNEHFTAYNIMALVCAGWLHEVQWVLCIAVWSMDMTGVYACPFEAMCDVTTVPSHLKRYAFWNGSKLYHQHRNMWDTKGRPPSDPTTLAAAKVISGDYKIVMHWWKPLVYSVDLHAVKSADQKIQ